MTTGEPQPGSTRPYLVRAIREWALDNGLTPYLVVDASVPGVQVPREHVVDDRITLNVADRAVAGGLHSDPETLSFGARFGGRHREIVVPWQAVLAVFARENGEGIAFAPEEAGDAQAAAADEADGEGAPEPAPPAPRGRPVLKRIK